MRFHICIADQSSTFPFFSKAVAIVRQSARQIPGANSLLLEAAAALEVLQQV